MWRYGWMAVAVGCVGQPATDDKDSGTPVHDSGTPVHDSGTPIDTGACDPTETPLEWHCQSDLCNYCTDDCTTRDALVPTLDLCGSTTGTYYCCTLDTCTDPEDGTFDRVTCPTGYGNTYWWFDPATGTLAGYAWSTDYNDWCDGASFGELFGPDLTNCQ